MSDLDRSLDWYTSVLGIGERIWEGKSSGPEVSEALQVPGAEVRIVCLQLHDGTILELLEFEQPRGRPFTFANSDIGMVHICFQVENIAAAYRELREKGVAFSAPPTRLDEGAGRFAGYAFALLRDPDGVQLELYQVPDHAER